jgi:hypothetical protein
MEETPMWQALVASDAALARAIGVTAPAIRKAAQRGQIRRTADGMWDILAVVEDWRATTRPGLQRPRRAVTFRPWLDGDVRLVGCIFDELVRRCDDVGADWRRAG